jgi:hypothetical protein
MQNLPDKGVSGFDHYLQADRTVTGLTGIVPESQGKNGRNRKAFPFWDTVREVAMQDRQKLSTPLGLARASE